MHTRSRGVPEFGPLDRHRRNRPRGSELERLPGRSQPEIRENPIFEQHSENSSESSESEEEEMAGIPNNDNNNNDGPPPPPVPRFGDLFRSGATHPDDLAYAADNVSIPPHFISLVNGGSLFHGREDEDPISHLNTFYELTGNHRPPGIPHDRIKRSLFSFSLRDRAREWYDSLPGYNIATFEELKNKFLLEFNSPARIERLRDAIHSFQQQGDETFAEAWQRFSDLLRKCPSHGMIDGRDLQKFYQSLNHECISYVNAGASGRMDEMSYDEVRALFNRLAAGQRTWYNPRKTGVMKAGTVGSGVDSARLDSMEAQLASIHTQVGTICKTLTSLQLNPQATTTSLTCGLCQGNHHTNQCQIIQGVEDVNYVGNNRQ